MKLSKVAVDILKNFASINQGLVFKPGQTLSTMNVMENTFATAEVPDIFPLEFAIYDLVEFLAAYSLTDSCEIQFLENMLVMKTLGGEETKYSYASPSVIVSPGDKKVRLPSEDKSFILTKEVFDKIIKVSSVLKLKDLVIDCMGVTITNRSSSTSNEHLIKLDVFWNGSNEKSLIKIDNLKLIPVDYDVSICNRGIARFTSRNADYKVQYHIALEVE